MAVFFTADTHFGHSGIIKLCKRPFRSLAEMDAALTDNWNARVGADDLVYHLGDFCFKGAKLAQRYLGKLNGQIVFLRGNHDTESTAKLDRWASVNDLLELRHEGVDLVLCHYPLLEWPGAFRGAFHLHGHTHGRIPPNCRRCDVGVDEWGYRPITWREIAARLETAPPYDPVENYVDQP